MPVRDKSMIELRWVWHDIQAGGPQIGSVCVGDRLYQKLQYRTKCYVTDNSRSALSPDVKLVWGEWADVPHCVQMIPNVKLTA